MCKIAVISGVNNKNRSNVWKLVHSLSGMMSSGNDKDGFGYAAMSSNGEVFGERWLDNSKAFVTREALSTLDKKTMGKYGGMLIKPETYNSFGLLDESNMTSITLHARFATSGKEFYNTHPFVRGKTSLIHNGVISNVNELELISSSCDSEGILNSYVKHKVMDRPEAIGKVAAELKGYYACGMFSEMKDGTKILDVFKDSNAQLSAAYINELEIVVFSTAADHIARSCSELGFTIGSWYGVKSGMLTRINAITGEVMLTQGFIPQYKGKSKQTRKYTKPDYSRFNETTGYGDKGVYGTYDEEDYEGYRGAGKYEQIESGKPLSIATTEKYLSAAGLNSDDGGWERVDGSYVKRGG